MEQYKTEEISIDQSEFTLSSPVDVGVSVISVTNSSDITNINIVTKYSGKNNIGDIMANNNSLKALYKSQRPKLGRPCSQTPTREVINMRRKVRKTN